MGVTNQSAYAKEDDQNIGTWSKRKQTKKRRTEIGKDGESSLGVARRLRKHEL